MSDPLTSRWEDAQRAVLGAALIDEKKLPEILASTTVTDHSPPWQAIYLTLQETLADTAKRMGKAKNDTERLQIAYEVFGKKAGAKIADGLKTGTIAFDDLGSAMAEYSGNIDTTYSATKDGIDDLALAMQSARAMAGSELSTVLNDHREQLSAIANGLTGSLIPALGTMVDWMFDAATWVSNNSTLLTGLGIVIGSITAGITAYNIVAGVRAAMEAAEATTLWGYVSAQIAANTAMFACPITWIVAGIAALIAIIVLCVKNWDTIKAAMSNVWNSIVAVWNGAGAWFQGHVVTPIVNTFTRLLNSARSIWNTIKSAVTTPILAAKSAVTTAVGGIFSTVSRVFGNVKTTISNAMNGAKNAVSTVINKIKGFFHFSFSWPKLKLPHFSISPPGWKVGDLLKGKIPKLGISWYATGGIMKRPTLFGGGEAGDEAILPLERNTGWMDTLAEVVASRVGGSAQPVDYDRIDSLIRQVVDGCTQSIYCNEREVARVVKEVR